MNQGHSDNSVAKALAVLLATQIQSLPSHIPQVIPEYRVQENKPRALIGVALKPE